MKSMILVGWLSFSLLGSEAAAFDYSPPILNPSEEALLDFGSGERKFFYDVRSTQIDPFETTYYRFGLLLKNQSDGRILRATSNRIPFSSEESVSASSKEYVTPSGNNWITLGGYDATDIGEGWIYIDLYQETVNDWWRQSTDLLIGLRFQLDDGVHYGWIRFSRADTHFTTVFQPQEYDWNPIPDAPIQAGKPPVIPIATEITAEGLRLSWSPGVTTWILESTEVLSEDAVWVPVPEAGGTEAWLDLPQSSRYFRLRRP